MNKWEGKAVLLWVVGDVEKANRGESGREENWRELEELTRESMFLSGKFELSRTKSLKNHILAFGAAKNHQQMCLTHNELSTNEFISYIAGNENENYVLKDKVRLKSEKKTFGYIKIHRNRKSDKSD